MLTFPLSVSPFSKKPPHLSPSLPFRDGGLRLLKSSGPLGDSWKQTWP